MKIRPKKSLGQNFLVNDYIANKIVSLGEITKEDVVLEVGPGTGVLTEKIINKNPKKIIVIEKDKNLANILEKKFDNKINIINEDILKFKENSLIDKQIIVFGNLPYNISTKILVKWIKLNNLEKVFKKLILMFQKEVADRIEASYDSKNYGRISILSSWKLDIKKIKNIEPNSFFPRPKVRSSLLEFKPKKKYFYLKSSSNLEYITNVFFKQRRKMIKKPLSQLFNNPLEISRKLKIDMSKRPQNLGPEKYFEICKELENLYN